MNKKSKFRDVNWHKTCKKWIVTAYKNSKRITIGYYDDFDEAVIMRLRAEEKYFKEFQPQIYKDVIVNE